MAPTSRWDANFVEKNAQGRNAEPIAGVANKTCRRGERPLFSPVNSETITKTLNCSAAVSESGDTVETKRAAHRFSAIRVRPLNDPHQGSLPTRSVFGYVLDATIRDEPDQGHQNVDRI